jgi:hypothetical protein
MTQFKPGSEHRNWKGGFYINRNGYKRILIGRGKYRSEHILVMEKEIGRPLNKDEVVHHINGMRADNKIGNLQLMSKAEHSRLHQLGRKATKETIQRQKEARAGSNQKEKHPQWKSHVTAESIVKILLRVKKLKAVAAMLGICPDTLRARMKYYGVTR